jgi:hypothetical protein
MHRHSFSWAAYAVGLLALIGALPTSDAPIHETRAVGVASASSSVPDPDEFEVASIVSSAVIESSTPVPVAATESLAAPDSAAAPAQPEQVAAPPAEAAPVVRVAVAARASPPEATCPVNQFCYPRVGIAGPIVPYSDCTGSTDVGTAIRSLTCLSPTYLVAHAYTQFGRIAGWRVGDIVFAHGVRYVLFDAFTQPGCVVAARPIAPLSLQTSLTSTVCGPILVVQGRIE